MDAGPAEPDNTNPNLTNHRRRSARTHRFRTYQPNIGCPFRFLPWAPAKQSMTRADGFGRSWMDADWTHQSFLEHQQTTPSPHSRICGVGPELSRAGSD